METEKIYLSLPQALDAIFFDLHQYEPQMMLLCEIAQTVCADGVTIKREPGSSRVWMRHARGSSMQALEAEDMVEFVCQTLHSANLGMDMLASICSRVFQTRARVVNHPQTGHEMICVETGMASYSCRQCGRCCRELDYRNELKAQDVQRWRRAGRHDILEWVGITHRENGEEAYSMWVIPGTNQFAEVCPFLEPGPKKNGPDKTWFCRIHEVKPDICRQYPVSRKHALMTGCRGFAK
jgi:Fe-S-cluster containining protein